MSLIAWPAGLCTSSFQLRQQTTQRVFASPFGGSEQVIDLQNDRWLASLSFPATDKDEAARLEAFVNALRGMTNTVLLHHWARPVPRGTMRGSPTAQAQAPTADSLAINTTAGVTLLAGDMIGVGGLLLQVAGDTLANGSGVMIVTFVNRLRTAIIGGAPVTWDKPSVSFRLSSQSAVQHVPGYAAELSLDFVEAIG